MKQQTPPKFPPMILSHKHQSSVEKSKSINKKVESFVKQNLRDSPSLSSEEKLAASQAWMTNTKAFFESELRLVMRMVQQSNKLYKQKQGECTELQQKIKEYESKIFQLEQVAIELTANKTRVQASKVDGNDERKTRRKTENEQTGKSKGMNRTTSEFRLNNDERFDESIKKLYEAKEEKLINRMKKMQEAIEKLQQKIRSQNQQMGKIFEQKRMISDTATKLNTDCLRLQKECNYINSQMKLIQQRYNQLENKHGQTVTEYEIKIANLKSVITGLNQKISPKKQSEKHEEGYYSINRPLNKQASQQSLFSNSSSKQFTPSHSQINLKEENQYLRTELIRILDEKGQLQMKVNKYKKLALKYENLSKIIKDQQSSASESQNSRFLSNFDKACEGHKSDKSFKKKRQTSILLVQGTEKKSKQISHEKKITRLLKEISVFVQTDKSFEFINYTDPQFSQIDFLEKTLSKLKENVQQQHQLRTQIRKLEDKIQLLEREKLNFREKSKKDVASLKKYLQDSQENFMTPKSQVQDSTDKAFKNINLNEIEQNQQDHQKSQEYQEFSKSIVNQYSQMIIAQQNQVKALKEQIATLEQTIQKLQKVNQKNTLAFQQSEESRSAKTEKNLQSEKSIASIDMYNLYKRHMSDFYASTMKEIEMWEAMIKGSRERSKQLDAIYQASNQNESNLELPQIVEKNILKLSQDFESIKNSSFDRSMIMQNEQYGNKLFGSQKLSKSFIKDQPEEYVQTFQDIINKKLENFSQFSYNWIRNLNTKEGQNKQTVNQEIQSKQMKELSAQLPKQEKDHLIRQLNGQDNSKTDKSKAQKSGSFLLQLEEIDAESFSIPEGELDYQRNLLIREELSYQMQNSNASMKSDILQKTIIIPKVAKFLVNEQLRL